MTPRWMIEFWDHDAWNVRAPGGYHTKQEAIDRANELNRGTSHRERAGCFGGRRYRVRRREETATK